MEQLMYECAESRLCFYVAGNLSLSVYSGLVPIALFLLQVVSQGMGICVGMARKKYGIDYPSLYAVPGTKRAYAPVTEATALLKDDKEEPKEEIVSDTTAYEFNCIQRGHQNFLEQVTCVVPLIVLNWFTFPLLAGICGILWPIFKIGYFVGYGYFGASGRLWGAGAYIPQLALYGITIWSAVTLFAGSTPY